jgi:hypothetical protein
MTQLNGQRWGNLRVGNVSRTLNLLVVERLCPRYLPERRSSHQIEFESRPERTAQTSRESYLDGVGA